MAAPREPKDHQAPKRTTRKATVRKPTPAELATTDDVDQTVPLQTEVDVELTGYIEVEMGGHVYHVKPQDEWRQSTQEALRLGMTSDWAEDVMPPEDYEAWLDADPTNRELGDFFEEMGRQAGIGLGESRALRRAYSRSMRRR